MKIEINKKQYEELIRGLNVSSFIYGTMSDFVDDKYKKDIKIIEEVEKEMLRYAKDFNFGKNIEKFEGENTLRERYLDRNLSDLNDYDEYITYENLARELGRRDFFNKHTKEEIKKMTKESNGYLGALTYDFDEKYYNEFNKYGYSRLYIKEDNDDKNVEEKESFEKEKIRIEREVKELLKKINSSFTFEDIKNIIYNEDNSKDIQKIVEIFSQEEDINKLQDTLDLVSGAWNYFPHKKLGGISPQEKLMEYKN